MKTVGPRPAVSAKTQSAIDAHGPVSTKEGSRLETPPTFFARQAGTKSIAAKMQPLQALGRVRAGGHTASNAPDLFRPPKLSGAGPG